MVWEIISLFAVFLSIFLYGLVILRYGLNYLSQNRVQRLLHQYTKNPIMGLLVGTISTGILQSSSVVMVILIGLLSSRLISFRNAIGLMLGANIGTTFSLELIAYSTDHLLFFFLITGAILLLLYKQVLFSFGAIFFGLGCIFTAMNGFESLADSLKTLTVVKDTLILAENNNLIGVSIGTFFSAIIQSSTAVSGISMALLMENLFPVSTAFAIVLGANIGTCVTAFIASIGSSKESKWIAVSHFIFNVIGVIIMYPFINTFMDSMSLFTDALDKQLAHASVLFNVLSAILVLPFVGKIGTFFENRA